MFGRFLFVLGQKIRMFMYGRYGFDEFSKFLLFSSVALMILSYIPVFRILYFFAVIFLVISYWRALSRNIAKRASERNKYLVIRGKFIKKTYVYKKIFADRKTHRYFKCKKCKSFTRVPKGIGKVEVSCRVCKHKMIRKS